MQTRAATVQNAIVSVTVMEIAHVIAVVAQIQLVANYQHFWGRLSEVYANKTNACILFTGVCYYFLIIWNFI
jgi:hypothetical protein